MGSKNKKSEKKKRSIPQIFYFSGTGNCLYIARRIAEETKGSLHSIAGGIKGTGNESRILLESDSLVIIFPSYLAPLCGVPLIVERFIRSIVEIGKKYIVTVCTCGGYEAWNAIPPTVKAEKIIKSVGGRLKEAYSVRLPMNNLDYDHIPFPIEKSSEKILTGAESKIVRINRKILKNPRPFRNLTNRVFYFFNRPLFQLMVKPVTEELRRLAKEKNPVLGYEELIPLTDRSIGLSQTCIGCGICAKVCPAGNIEIVSGKPRWNNRCEMCFACDEWCPQDAIHHWSRKKGVKYHHPKVSVNDFN